MTEEYFKPDLHPSWLSLKFDDYFYQPVSTLIKVKNKETKEVGEIPVVDQGSELISGYTDTENQYSGEKPVIIFGDHTRNIKFIDFPFAIGADGTKLLHPFKGIHPKFVYHYLRSINIVSRGYSRHYKILKQIPFPLPPYNEQKRIADKLDTIFKELNEIKERLNRVPEILKKFRQSVLQRFFQTINKETFLENVCEKIQDGSHYSPKHQLNEREPGYFPYVTSKNIRNNFMILDNLTFVDAEFHNEIYKRCDVKKGDVLLTKDGANTGNVTLNELDEPFSLLSSVCLIRPRKDIILPDYIKLFIQSDLGKSRILGNMNGTAIKRITLKKIKKSVIPLASLEDQKQIIREIENWDSSNYNDCLSKVRYSPSQIEQSILKTAFEGKLVPQDPNDEPASALLEKIKAERAKLEAEKKAAKESKPKKEKAV